MGRTSGEPAATAERLVTLVETVTPRLLALDELRAARRPDRDRWSPKEVLGHLIDSAAVNHGRFVRAALDEETLAFPGYEQDGWVELQDPGEAPWDELVVLWRGLNLHVARLIRRIPVEVAARGRPRHGLEEIAWGRVPAGEPASLGWFLEDYVDHLEHHLTQIPAIGGG